jgi:hypothetical protein
VDKRQSQDAFRAEITAHDDDVITLELFGELDLVSMAHFEAALAAVLMRSPRRVIFDLSAAQFISAQGFAAMGRCSGDFKVAVCSSSRLALKNLRALGYDEVECIQPRLPPAPHEPARRPQRCLGPLSAGRAASQVGPCSYWIARGCRVDGPRCRADPSCDLRDPSAIAVRPAEPMRCPVTKRCWLNRPLRLGHGPC